MVLLDARRLHCRAAPRAHCRALHVHHGLSPNADLWAAFCAANARDRNIAFDGSTRRVDRRPAAQPRSRGARRRATSAPIAVDADVVAARAPRRRPGGNRAAAAAARRRAARAGRDAAMCAHAPAVAACDLLALPRATLAATTAHAGCDGSTTKATPIDVTRRNFLRHSPCTGARRAVSRLSRDAATARPRHQADAAELLDELARIDAADDAGRGLGRSGAWRGSPRARARNLLRWFLRRHGLRPPSHRAPRDDAGAVDDRRARRVDSPAARRRRNRLPSRTGQGPCAPRAGRSSSAGMDSESLQLPGGTLTFDPGVRRGTRGTGPGRCRGPCPRSRHGGEPIQSAREPAAPGVKKLLQDAGVPAWERETLPFIWYRGRAGRRARHRSAPAISPGPQAGWRMEWRRRGLREG